MLYHKNNTAAPETDTLVLNTTAATDDTISRWYDTAPTSVLVTLGESRGVNDDSSKNFVAYCFTGKQGFSKFGGYTGNGYADGVFVYTGFRPAFLMTKNTGATSDWAMYDNKRNAFNPIDNYVYANTTDAEDPVDKIAFLANGFKLISSATPNNSGHDFIYMAFAEVPLVNSNGVPGCAR